MKIHHFAIENPFKTISPRKLNEGDLYLILEFLSLWELSSLFVNKTRNVVP